MQKTRLSPEQLQCDVNDYFRLCDATAETVLLKSGAPSVRQIPYTLAGLSAHIGMDKGRIKELAEGKGRRSRNIREPLRDAMRRIERYTVERALLGELQLSLASLLLRDMGYGADLAAPDEKGLVIRMDDPKGWGE